MSFKDCLLWRNAFEEERADASRDEQRYFSSQYLALREKASALVGRISTDMPDMTVHDISHLDALWEMASLVSVPSFDLNPPEAFVFGGAVLLHDAAMTLAAYPKGISELKETTTWKDIFSRLKLVNEEAPEQLDFIATNEALRTLHARQASVLPTEQWIHSGKPYYLIDDPEIRSFYGTAIGSIAASHWWNINDLENNFIHDLGPLAGRTKNRISQLKIACLLRVSDAMHIDRRRAPSFLKVLLNPKGISNDHWLFQERMAAPYIEQDALVYSASPHFELASANAWWLAYDTICMIDRELRQVDNLLLENGITPLKARRVKGSGSPLELSKYIRTSSWTPVDSTIKVSDVPKIVEKLGGTKLYGNDPKIALRELLQNSLDAIEARRRLQQRDGNWGKVTVSLTESNGEYLLTVEDTGVGMSSAVLTGPLIDFGNSFWRSSMASEELPGIQASGMVSVGRYGIGFFSVFMLGSRVSVTSRRYDKSSDTIHRLEFRNGLKSRPILYAPETQKNTLIDGGTIVEVALDIHPELPGGILNHSGGKNYASLDDLVATIAPNIHVAITTDHRGKSADTIHAGDWLSIDEKVFFRRLSPTEFSEYNSSDISNIRTLVDGDGTIYGRAAIKTFPYFLGPSGCITVGGFRATYLPCICGIMLGDETTLSRNEAVATVPPNVLASWASSQAELICKSNISDERKARSAETILYLGGDPKNLPVVRFGDVWRSSAELQELADEFDEFVIFVGSVEYDEDSDECHPKLFEKEFIEADDVLFIMDSLRSSRESLKEKIPGIPADKSILIEQYVINTVAQVWGISLEEVNQYWSADNRLVGRVDHWEIYRRAKVLCKPDIFE